MRDAFRPTQTGKRHDCRIDRLYLLAVFLNRPPDHGAEFRHHRHHSIAELPVVPQLAESPRGPFALIVIRVNEPPPTLAERVVRVRPGDQSVETISTVWDGRIKAGCCDNSFVGPGLSLDRMTLPPL